MATNKFHFNPASGRTGKCEAKRKCKYGQSDSEHGETPAQARGNYEKAMESETFSNVTQNRQKDLQKDSIVKSGVASVLATPVIADDYYEKYDVKYHHDVETAVDSYEDAIKASNNPEVALEDALDAIDSAFDAGRKTYSKLGQHHPNLENEVRASIERELEDFKII